MDQPTLDFAYPSMCTKVNKSSAFFFFIDQGHVADNQSFQTEERQPVDYYSQKQRIEKLLK